jgi:hypothetical protein
MSPQQPTDQETAVRITARIALVSALSAMFVLGASGIAAAKEVSNEKYAKRLCGAMQDVYETIDAMEQNDATDPAAFQTAAIAQVDELVASMSSAKAKLKKLAPEDGGKLVTKLFDKYLTEFTGVFEDAKTEFAAADPTSPAFTGDVTVFTVALSNAAIGLDDPFSKLSNNQDLLSAFGDEKSCKDVVTIYGG